MAVVVLPDVVALCREYLITVPELTAVVGTRIATRSPDVPAYPYITMQRIGGASIVANRFDQARIQFDAWAATEHDASLAVRTLRGALFALEHGGFVSRAGVLTGAVDIAGPQWIPDTTVTPPIPRFSTLLAVGAHTP